MKSLLKPPALLVLSLLTACGPADTPARTDTVAVSQPQPGAVSMTTPVSYQLASFGHLVDGREAQLLTLKNANGIELDVTNYGGIITRLLTPDAQGELADIVLGYDSLAEYQQHNPYFGAIIGRYGNRIANGRFTLQGEQYQLATNDGANHLHGGDSGFDKRLWQMTPFSQEDGAGVELTLLSPDGDEGYPGNLQVKVVYKLTNSNELQISFSASTDRTTVVNLTQHSYFNLAGGADILQHQLTMPATHITPVDAGLIPTGELQAVAGSAFDFRQGKAIGRDINNAEPQLALGQGYDHNFVLKTQADNQLQLAARVLEPSTGRVLEVLTDAPAVQFYSGNFLDGSINGKGRNYGHRSGFCLEPQHFPDSPNQPAFPSTVLQPGQTYQMRMVYRFLTQS